MGQLGGRALAGRALGLVLAAAALGTLAVPGSLERRRLQQRLDVLTAGRSGAPGPGCAGYALPTSIGGGATASALASWQTVGGCGAGAGTSSSAAVKWIGRGVTGGAVQIQCQSTMVRVGGDRTDLASALQVSRSLAARWSVGVSVPYLYKSQERFPRPDLKLANRGLGDVGLMAARRFGALDQTTVSLWVGLPTGVHDARWQFGAQSEALPLDLQLSLGRPTSSLILDHTIDRDWGPIVLGASANHRGGSNRLGNHRPPQATAYAYSGFVFGSFVPAVGVTMLGALDHDRSLGVPLDNPRFSLALNGSVEWASDWLALLVGVSLPYSQRGGGIHLEAWLASAGVALSPF